MGQPRSISRCVLYVRISLATEESVSIDRQIESGRAYARARGWEVVGVFRDEGVSATHNRPQHRAGWRALLDSAGRFDAVVIWKVDRLARRVIDFLTADDALAERGAGLVAVEDPVDMTTPQGRAFAQVLAVFGELEAATTSSRVTASRAHLLTNGRYAGGRLPYGYRSVPNPGGAGHVVVQDPDRIEWVRQMVERTQAGHSVHSTTRWLDEQGAPTYTGAERWSYNTVRGILHHPLLAGLVPHNPGRRSRRRGDGVVLGENGLDLVHPHLAVMPVGRWRAMVARLDDPDVDPRRMPRAQRKSTSGLLSGLVYCGDLDRHPEPARMHRGTRSSVAGTSYSCPTCHQTLSNVDGLVVEEFLRVAGELPHLDLVEEVLDGDAAEYAEATVRLQELSARLALAAGEEFADLVNEIGRVKAVQSAASRGPAVTRLVPSSGATRTFAEDWDAAEDDERRRVILGHALDRVLVSRGRQGAWTAEAKRARMSFEWTLGQYEAPSDEQLNAWATADDSH